MPTVLLSAVFAAFLFGGVLACMRIGWRVGRKRLLALGEDGHSGLGAIDGAVFGLMGLLIAFTFTGAATRFDARRSLVTEHVNAIGTAWLRLDLLAEPEREKRATVSAAMWTRSWRSLRTPARTMPCSREWRGYLRFNRKSGRHWSMQSGTTKRSL